MRVLKSLAAHADTGLYAAIMALLFAVIFFAAAMISVSDLPTPTPQPTDAAPTADAVAFTVPTETPAPTLPPPPTPIPPTDAPQNADIVHTVQFGDTLYAIGRRYGASVENIIAANQPQDLTTINVGQQIRVPVNAIIATSAALGLPTPNADAQIIITATPAPNWIVNGIDFDTIFTLSPEVLAHVTQVYALGQSMGRNPRAFSKLGDSTIENPHFMSRFDEGTYNLGPYAFLQPTIDYFAGSFRRQGPTVRRGLHTWAVLDPMWAAGCSSGQHMLACEFAQHNPAFIIIRLGSNDVGIPKATEENLREIVEYCIKNGVVPIMGTKADRFEGAGNINNDIIRKIAQEYKLPLWDFDVIAATIPNRGLGGDSVHMTTFFAHDWNLPNAYTTGVGVHTITALMALDRLRQAFAPPS